MIYEHFLLKDKMGFEEIVESACKNREIPGVVVVAYGPGKYYSLVDHVADIFDGQACF